MLVHVNIHVYDNDYMEMTTNIPYSQLIYITQVHTSCAHSLIRDDLVNYWIVLTNYLFGHSMGERGIAYPTDYN